MKAIFETPWFSWYIHRIHEEDTNRWPHDDPWAWSVSYVVKGAYTEEVFDPPSKDIGTIHYRHPFAFRRMRAQAHRITYVVPGTVISVWAGRRVRTWGFWTNGRFVPHESGRSDTV